MARTCSLVFCLGLCLSQLAVADEPTAVPPATTEEIQQTVDRAIVYIQAESASWLSTRGCRRLSSRADGVLGIGEADRQGYAIDKKYLADKIESLLGSKDKLLTSKIFPNPADPPDPRRRGEG